VKIAEKDYEVYQAAQCFMETREVFWFGCRLAKSIYKAISILNKVRIFKEESLSVQVSSMKPFGLRTFYKASDK